MVAAGLVRRSGGRGRAVTPADDEFKSGRRRGGQGELKALDLDPSRLQRRRLVLPQNPWPASVSKRILRLIASKPAAMVRVSCCHESWVGESEEWLGVGRSVFGLELFEHEARADGRVKLEGQSDSMGESR
jgi:hypothetical protein